ncbi:MAG: VCBS repeat-containing protein [Planctomycetes bacterium]|nr:VCBS repeat-containing protein [Planctomycetota bacterium]
MLQQNRALAVQLSLLVPLLSLSSCNKGGGDGGVIIDPPPPAPLTVDFGAPMLSTTGGAGGQGLVVADIDHDGLGDVVVGNATLANVSVMRNQGDGRFGAGSSVPAPALVGPIAVADVTGDRILDLVSASSASAAATVSPGVGDGTFQTAVALAVPWPVGRLAVVDWNADGRVDVVLAGATDLAVAVMPGIGGGAFGAAVVMATNFVVTDFAVADFDGDRRLDLACVGRGSAAIDVLRNDGAGGFLPVVSTAAEVLGGRLACGDLDGDQRADLVVLLGDLVTVAVFQGIGSASFAVGATLGIAANAVDAIDVGDLDGDGVPDLAATAGTAVVAAYGDGHGGMTPAEVVFDGGSAAQSVVIADLRGIGVVDIAYVSAGSEVGVLQNPRISVPGLESYGAGSPGCGGAIGLWANGSPVIGNADFAFIGTNAPANAFGMMMVGGPPDLTGSDPFGVGITLHLGLGPTIFTFVVFSDGLGTSFIDYPIPATPGLAGLEIYAQLLWMTEPATTCADSPLNVVSSRGLIVTLLP